MILRDASGESVCILRRCSLLYLTRARAIRTDERMRVVRASEPVNEFETLGGQNLKGISID